MKCVILSIMKTFLILFVFLFCFGKVSAAPISTTNTPSASDLIKIQNLSYDVSINEGDIDVNVTPEFPSAFQKVSIRLDSNTVDLNRYLIQWYVDEVPKLSGIGERNFQITAPNYGNLLKINVTIKLGTDFIQKNITIAPQDVTVLWEAIDSYVPPFYRGKKLASQESLIKVSALPNFQTANNSLALDNAVYLWDRNGNKILNVGGYAKDSIIIQHNRLRASENISAEVSTVSGGTRAKKTITIPITDPEIHWYTKNISDYRRLIATDQGFRVKSGDTKLVAEPYFFSINKGFSDLVFSWLMNNQTIYLTPDSSNQEILIRNPNKDGQTNFSLNISNPRTFLQKASKSVPIFFDAPEE